MDLPPGFEDNERNNLVCKLKRSLYGLKQSPRVWFKRFTRTVKGHDFTQGQIDHTLLFRHSSNGKISILIAYVDDIILTGNDLEEMERLQGVMAREFEIKDLEPLRYFLGMEVARTRKGIVVSQKKYTLDLFKETRMLGCKPVDTPIDQNKKNKTGTPVDKGGYQRLVGKLIYLSPTRLDIDFAISMVGQYMHASCEEHLETVFQILRYLKITPRKGLFLRKS